MSTHSQKTRWSPEAVRATNAGTMLDAIGFDPLEISPGRCVAAIDFRPDLTQPMGIFHGGAILTLADAAATYAALTLTDPDMVRAPGRVPLTVQLSANFVRNTDRGRITATAEVVHAGRTTQVVQTTVTDNEGRLLAVVTTTHVTVPAAGNAQQ